MRENPSIHSSTIKPKFAFALQGQEPDEIPDAPPLRLSSFLDSPSCRAAESPLQNA